MLGRRAKRQRAMDLVPREICDAIEALDPMVRAHPELEIPAADLVTRAAVAYGVDMVAVAEEVRRLGLQPQFLN